MGGIAVLLTVRERSGITGKVQLRRVLGEYFGSVIHRQYECGHPYNMMLPSNEDVKNFESYVRSPRLLREPCGKTIRQGATQ
jgi:hypothetical protein